MEHHTLSHYVPKIGDRMAVYRFCERCLPNIVRESKKKKRKTAVLDRLRKKLHLVSSRKKHEDVSSDSSDHDGNIEPSSHRYKMAKNMIGNSHAVKQQRVVKFGLVQRRNNKYIHLRALSGGGTRTVNVSKYFKKKDLIEFAKSLYFIEGTNKLGNVDDFTYDMLDFQEEPLSDDKTVGSLYEETRLPKLSFYLIATDLTIGDIDKPASSKDTQRPVSECESGGALLLDNPTVKVSGDVNVPVIVDRMHDCESPSTSYAVQSTDNHNSSNLQDNEDIGLQIFLASTLFKSVGNLNANCDTSVVLNDALLDDSGVVTFNLQPYDECEHAEIAEFVELANCEHEKLAETLPLEWIIRVHRGHAMDDMLHAFENPVLDPVSQSQHIKIQMILPNGEEEQAEDEGGVTRDCISEFWQTFYNRCSLGNKTKIPYLRHDFAESRWEAVGRVLIYGFKRENYFPIQLSQPFIEQCLFDSCFADMERAFFEFIPGTESALLDKALVDFSKVDLDDLLDVLSDHGCKVKPTPGNLQYLLRQISHKELIQTPMFIIDCMSKSMKGNGIMLNQLNMIYNDLVPTPKKVLKLLDFPCENLNQGQSAVRDYLRKYIKEMDETNLKLFLKYCTGADQLVGKQIGVRFSQLTGASRRPIAHTCGCVLELPVQYDDYLDFRFEFHSVLSSGVWVMDIV